MLGSITVGSRERMSGVDTAWLRMERPTNLMMITGVMILDGKLDFERLKHLYQTRFLSFARFRQRVVRSARVAFWETDPEFDIDAHVHRIALPGNADKEELEELVSDLASTPLDYSKPLWQVHLVENYRGGSAVVLRIHHCYADGIALIQVLLSMTTSEPDEDMAGGAPRRRGRKGTQGLWRLVPGPMRALVDPARHLFDDALKASTWLREESLRLLRNPVQVGELARRGADVAAELARLALMPDDPHTRLMGKPGVRKRVAWAEPIPLDEVKAVGKALGCTVNDALLSVVAGALRDYLVEHGDRVDGLEVRAAVPVNLRPIEHAHRLGNHFGLVLMGLPIGIESPLERVYAVKRNMQALKGSYQAVVAFGLLNAIGLGPAALQTPALDLLSKKASAVMTNVPGPQQPLYLAGARIAQQMFWVPQSGNITMGVSILSYDGSVQFGLITDARTLPDPNVVVSRFGQEFERLVLTTLMEAWDEDSEPGRPS